MKQIQSFFQSDTMHKIRQKQQHNFFIILSVGDLSIQREIEHRKVLLKLRRPAALVAVFKTGLKNNCKIITVLMETETNGVCGACNSLNKDYPCENLFIKLTGQIYQNHCLNSFIMADTKYIIPNSAHNYQFIMCNMYNICFNFCACEQN